MDFNFIGSTPTPFAEDVFHFSKFYIDCKLFLDEVWINAGKIKMQKIGEV
jgi:hypothetical protein